MKYDFIRRLILINNNQKMKKFIFSITLLLPILLFSQVHEGQKKVLMIVSSYGKDKGSIRPGYEFDEFSQAYLIFKNNNLLIDVASPKGGKVEADKFNIDKLYNKIILEDENALKLLENTKATANVNAEDYNAIYIVGGKGAMFDLPYDPSLQDIILNLYQRENTIISSVCHGPAAFIHVKDNEEYIINGIELTSFCNVEEELFGKKWVNEFPFSLETKLKERGAIFEQTDFMLSKVVVSGKFVTGQNPFSTTKCAEELVKSLRITPVDRELYSDEKSVYLIQELLDNVKTFEWAEKEIEKNKEKYDIPLIAAYGYYKIIASTGSNEELKKGIKLLELTSSHFFNENLQLFLAKTYVSTGKKAKAIRLLNELISKDLLKDKATKLLEELEE